MTLRTPLVRIAMRCVSHWSYFVLTRTAGTTAVQGKLVASVSPDALMKVGVQPRTALQNNRDMVLGSSIFGVRPQFKVTTIIHSCVLIQWQGTTATAQQPQTKRDRQRAVRNNIVQQIAAKSRQQTTDPERPAKRQLSTAQTLHQYQQDGVHENPSSHGQASDANSFELKSLLEHLIQQQAELREQVRLCLCVEEVAHCSRWRLKLAQTNN